MESDVLVLSLLEASNAGCCATAIEMFFRYYVFSCVSLECLSGFHLPSFVQLFCLVACGVGLYLVEYFEIQS